MIQNPSGNRPAQSKLKWAAKKNFLAKTLKNSISVWFKHMLQVSTQTAMAQ